MNGQLAAAGCLIQGSDDNRHEPGGAGDQHGRQQLVGRALDDGVPGRVQRGGEQDNPKYG